MGSGALGTPTARLPLWETAPPVADPPPSEFVALAETKQKNKQYGVPAPHIRLLGWVAEAVSKAPVAHPPTRSEKSSATYLATAYHRTVAETI